MANRNQDNADATLEREAAQHVANLAKAYNTAAEAASGLTEEETKLLGLSKQLELSLQNIVASKVLRNNESRTTKQINQELKNLEASRDKMSLNQLSLSIKLKNELREQRIERIKAGREINLQNVISAKNREDDEKSQRDIYNLSQLNNQIKSQILLNASAYTQNQIDNLNNQITANKVIIENEQIKSRGYKSDIRHADRIIKDQQKIFDLTDNKVKAIKNTQKENNTIIKQLDEEIAKLKEVKKITEGEESSKKITDFFKSKIAMVAALLGLKNLIETLFEADKSVTDLASNLGVSRELGQDIRNTWVEYVKTVKDGSLAVKDMFEAQANLSKELGISVIFADEELKTFNDLTKLMGVSVKAAGTLVKLSKSTGKEYKEYVLSAIKSANLAQKANNIQVSTKDVLEDIGNLSAGILVKFQGNPTALGAAVIQAKKLGLSLEQVDKIGESLLNWESSIENELKAELLTGRELNLERARSAALFGDQASLMAEISSQVGTQADFTNLNVLAQKSLAESFGLSREEMSEMLLKQQALLQYGKQAQNLSAIQLEEQKNSGLSMEEYLYNQQAQLSLQEKFNNSMDKMKQTIVDIVDGPFGQLLNTIISILNNTTFLHTSLILIGGVLGGMMLRNLWALISGVYSLVGSLASATSLSITLASALTLGGALIGIGASIYAINKANEAAAASAKKFQKPQDGIAPSSRGPFTITDNYGATAITANGDGLAVSPNINIGSNNQSQYDWKKLEDKLEKLIGINQQQYEVAKGGNVIQINEFALGKAAPLASSKENSRTFY